MVLASLRNDDGILMLVRINAPISNNLRHCENERAECEGLGGSISLKDLLTTNRRHVYCERSEISTNSWQSS